MIRHKWNVNKCQYSNGKHTLYTFRYMALSPIQIWKLISAYLLLNLAGNQIENIFYNWTKIIYVYQKSNVDVCRGHLRTERSSVSIASERSTEMIYDVSPFKYCPYKSTGRMFFLTFLSVKNVAGKLFLWYFAYTYTYKRIDCDFVLLLSYAKKIEDCRQWCLLQTKLILSTVF